MNGLKSLIEASKRTVIDNKKTLLFFLLLFIIAVVVYVPAIKGDFIWDDEHYITGNETLKSIGGLARIWFEPLSIPQYYPMVHTSFWIEYRLWGLDPLGYHVTNVIMHLLCALLLWAVIERLGIPGALLAAAIFALHPVNLESAAWITERKNVLSTLFYLAALFVYLPLAVPPAGASDRKATEIPQDSFSHKRYVAALVLFACALLSKTVAASLPAAIMVIVWFKTGRITMKRTLRPLIPFFLLSITSGIATVLIEKYHVGAQGSEWSFSLIDRMLIAGRALWFYLGKLLLPINLAFIYPRWSIDSSQWWQYIFPIAALGLVLVLFILRGRIGRGPLAAALFFGGTLVPALGFFDVYPMRFSFVADHFQYLASLGVITLVSALFSRWFLVKGAPLRIPGLCLSAAILFVLGVLTWQGGYKYTNLETLWKDTIAKNPEAWIAHSNLGMILRQRSELDQAAYHFREAVKSKEDLMEARYNLGLVYFDQQKYAEALEEFMKALRRHPRDEEIHYDIGATYVALGDRKNARDYFTASLNLNPKHGLALYRLALLAVDEGAVDEALKALEKAVMLRPNFLDARLKLAMLQSQKGDFKNASENLLEASRQKPDDPSIHNNLGIVLMQNSQAEESLRHFAEALRLAPNYARAHNNLGIVLRSQGKLEEARNRFAEALKIDPSYEAARRNYDATTSQIESQKKTAKQKS
ncbi:MAG: tetratricopeptide repeat protein [Deltaproteobacteria bacterium]|nr:tetratricopeptide repeat protein [Deltaproteobacteria bacterium]